MTSFVGDDQVERISVIVRVEADRLQRRDNFVISEDYIGLLERTAVADFRMRLHIAACQSGPHVHFVPSDKDIALLERTAVEDLRTRLGAEKTRQEQATAGSELRE